MRSEQGAVHLEDCPPFADAFAFSWSGRLDPPNLFRKSPAFAPAATIRAFERFCANMIPMQSVKKR